MSDYFARAVARADPVPVTHRAEVSRQSDEPDVGIEEVEAPVVPGHEGGSLVPGRESSTRPPEPWPDRPVVQPLLREVAFEPASPAPAPAESPLAALDVPQSRDEAPAEPGTPSLTTFQPLPVEEHGPAWPTTTGIGTGEPVPPEQVIVVAGQEPAHPDEVQRPSEPPQVAQAPDDPLALADAVMWGPVEPRAAVVAAPEASVLDVSVAESAPGPAVVIDRLTIELVDDRPAPAAEPAPHPRPRPTGRLVAGRRFDSGWGW